MGRPEKPVDPQAGPVQRLAWQLRRLRESAGNPSYRALARRAHYSASTLADAAKGERLPSLEVTLAYAEACGGDPAEWQALWSAAAEAPAPQRADERCPYRGLRAFRPEEAEWFFGRSALVDRLLTKVDRLAMVGVYGASGSGKSSLLRAGLLGAVAADPRLARRWRPMLLTPTEHRLEALSDLVTKLSGADRQRVQEELAADPAALDIAVRGALAAGPPDARALLVVDQFEEVFTLCTDREERRRFIAALLDATQGGERRTTVVLGVRADFLAHLTQYTGLLDALDDEAHLLVGPLTGAELREVVTRPAARAGIGVEPDLLGTLLADAADEPGALPLVSHALLETWQRRDGAALTLAAYHASGGVRGAIAQTAERVHAGFDAAERQAARRIFLRLTALGDGTEDTRRPIARTELDGVADTAVTARVLDELTEARLVVLGDGTVEVAHEALIRAWPRLHRWLTDDRAGLLAHRRLTDAAHTWASLRRDPGALLRGVQLAAARGLAEDRPGELNDLESAFLRASDALAEAEQLGARRQARLLKRLVAGMAALLVLALLGGGVAVRQRQDARRQQLAALAEEVSLRARSLLSTDPELAGLLAAEAERLHPSVETRGSVLSAAVAPRRTELNAGGPSVYGVAFSPAHALLAAAAGDGTIGLWDPVRGARVATLSGHTGRAAGVAFNGDGTRLASIGIDGTKGAVIVWDTTTLQPVSRYEETDSGSSIAFSADGTLLATATTTGGIVVRNLRTGIRTVLAGQANPATSLTFSADGKLLASADGHDAPKVWDVATGAVVAELTAERVVSVAFGATGYVLASSADDRGVHLWDLGGGRPAPLPPLPLAGRYAWTISAPAGDTIAVADENGAVTVWDYRRGVPLQTFQDRGRTETASVALSPDGTFLASSGFNGTIVVHDLAGQPFGGFTAQVKDVKASPDGNVVASAGTDGTVRLWDGAGQPIGTLAGHPDEVQAVAFGPDGHLLATVTRTNLVTIWDVRQQRHVAPPLTATGAGVSTDIAFDATGTVLAAATLGQSLWNVQDLDRPADITARFGSRIVTSLAFTPDGRRLFGASAGGYVNVWDVGTGRQLSRYGTGQSAVQDIAVSPDGTVVATAGDSRTVKLWDAASGQELATLGGHTAPVQVLAFSRDGRRLASAGDDHTVVVWDLAARRPLVTLTGHGGRVRGLAFTAAGALVSGAEDGRIISWSFDVATARARLCTGRSLTPQEWASHLPSVPYRPSCGSSAIR
ncbi:nSTAND1 domain-containing NTPase [Dactylosporangium darangshiense]|uniref:HTH cro/C1-type domain-containing protein n=1 Tax=Dactylosporangium darangshiense TaxID=579108 RepID=A0ABP8DH43_9ACTN